MKKAIRNEDYWFENTVLKFEQLDEFKAFINRKTNYIIDD